MIIEKSIIHVLDKSSKEPVVSNEENHREKETQDLISKFIRKVLRDRDLRKAKFNNYNDNEIRFIAEKMIYSDDRFVDKSIIIANKLFSTMLIDSDITSGDLLVVKFLHKGQNYIGLLLLDYCGDLYTHNISVIDGDIKIDIIKNDVAIKSSQKILYAAIIGPNSINDEWDLYVLDKFAEAYGLDSSFVFDFLDVTKILDDTYYTKKFYEKTLSWGYWTYKNDLEQIENLYQGLCYELEDNNFINVEAFADNWIEDDYRNTSYKEEMKIMNIKNEFEIDSNWVKKTLKYRSISTDTGFRFRCKMEDLFDPMKYTVKRNENGTYDITLKNVSQYL